MSIGQHKIGKMFMGLRASINSGMSSLYTHKGKDCTLPQTTQYNVDGVTADQLPKAPQNPYRKRPVKLNYDINDFHMFRLPSEKAFLLGSLNT